jgi:hypothetical protein
VLGRHLTTPCVLALAVALGGCSTGVQEADRAIFSNACAAGTGATDAECACAYDDLARGGGGSDQIIQETIDDLQRGRVPQRVTRAVARCSTTN